MQRTITQHDLVRQISGQTGLSENQVSDVVSLLLDNITGHLGGRSEVVLKNFGSLWVPGDENGGAGNPLPGDLEVRFQAGRELVERCAAAVPAESGPPPGPPDSSARQKGPSEPS